MGSCRRVSAFDPLRTFAQCVRSSSLKTSQSRSSGREGIVGPLALDDGAVLTEGAVISQYLASASVSRSPAALIRCSIIRSTPPLAPVRTAASSRSKMRRHQNTWPRRKICLSKSDQPFPAGPLTQSGAQAGPANYGLASEFKSLGWDSEELGWGGRIRTCECRYQKPVPYHLATPQQAARRCGEGALIASACPKGTPT